MSIYVVEDDDNIRELLLYALKSGGFEARGFTDAETLAQGMRDMPPALIILDIMLPGEDGISILKRFKEREKTSDIPVILLTAKSAEYDRIKGLELGADDYITKPFSVMEVIARVKAVLRRSKQKEAQPQVLNFAGIELDGKCRTVTANGAEAALTFKEFELLRCLMLNKGRVLTRENLLELVWGFDYFGESRTVDMHIKTLRQKLGGAGASIKTVRNVGYKIEA
ncbi:MAG: response regulator transcription factor [Spirochaetaceae bacterium]|jgi:two-component system alkaline phosphatase synthesis response regulator PhoP|nr:response regulator transcription factor [Spirochaetaceae bacterium]